jgi:6-phosphogluconolactonase
MPRVTFPRRESQEESLGAQQTFLFVGGCNRPTPYFARSDAPGISCFAFDENTAKTTPLAVTEGIDNPTFLAADSCGKRLYAGSEVHGWSEGTVSAYEIEPSTGALLYVNKQPTRGSTVAQFSFDQTGRFLLLVNYTAAPPSQGPDRSLVVFPLVDGEIGPATADARHIGSGPRHDRQERSHAHAVLASPDNRFLLVSDLGLDEIIVYRFDADRGAIERSGAFALPPGSGPRHFVFHPRLPLVYLSNELSSTVATLGYDTASGGLTILDITQTVPDEARTGNACAEIRLSSDARRLYVSNRGHDSLSLMDVDDKSGRLGSRGTYPSEGKTPRHFAFDPSGRFIAVANQDSGLVSFFAVDRGNGELKPVSSVAVGAPTCVCFVQTSS